MYAIIRTGGKQYRVEAGKTVRVEKLDQKLGSEFDIPEVLFVGGETSHLGAPTVKNAKVSVVVTRQAKDSKILVFKKKRRQGYRRMQGHRQFFTELFVKSITAPDGKSIKAETKPIVIDPAKKAERLAAHQEKAVAAAKAAGGKQKVAIKKAKAAPKKKVAKKAAPKKSGAKKTAKKSSGAKKASKKTSKK